ncbi:hypothetical protein ACIG47_13095 [Promicromonospora sp. NPDC052451]|uniref:hypothetical protein n=1 Tax=Promicromonospora sp. NPDC052451 TaxID=3364407 RepID=UPI0037CC7636
MTRTASAAVGVVAVVAAFLVERHYLQVAWVIDLPVPVVWWWLGAVLGVLGLPLLLTSLGRAVEQPAIGSWRRLLLGWTLPLLVAHVAWLGFTLVVLRQFNSGFTGIPARGLPEIVPLVLLPPPEYSLLWSLALAPLVARLTWRLPTAVVVAGLAALTLLTPAVTFLVFLLAGLRLGAVADRLAETADRRALVQRGAVALVGASVLGVPRFPDDLAVVVAGLAVLPFALTLVARISAGRFGHRGLTRVGTAAVAIYLVQIPVLALVDHAALARLGYVGQGAQYAVAVLEPLVLTAVVVLCGVVATALVEVVARRLRPRGGAGSAPTVPGPAPVLSEVDR